MHLRIVIDTVKLISGSTRLSRIIVISCLCRWPAPMATMRRVFVLVLVTLLLVSHCLLQELFIVGVAICTAVTCAQLPTWGNVDATGISIQKEP